MSMPLRSTGALLLRDGRKVFRVGTVAERIACIKEYQIIQDDIGLYTINVVVSAPLHDFETKELIENLQADVGRVSVRVKYVHALKRSQAGKFLSSNVKYRGKPYKLPSFLRSSRQHLDSLRFTV
jgi:hypothetical protein